MVDASYVRLARKQDGISYYIVPVASVLPPSQSTARCRAAIAAAVRAELRQIPKQLRAPTLSTLSQLMARQREQTQQASQPGICLMTSGPNSSGGTCGYTASDIEQTGLLATYGRISGVVPDGVATVTLEFPVSHGNAAQTITANVIGNVFATSSRSDLPLYRGNRRPAMIWRSATGKVIRTVPATAARGSGGRSAFCSGKPGTGGC
jgi:hypothetical protein